MNTTKIATTSIYQQTMQPLVEQSSVRDFSDVLKNTQTAVSHSAKVKLESATEQKVRQAAQQLVSSAFILPMLQQMRDDPFKSDLFHGGRGEEVFAQQWNTIVADDMVKSSNFPVVDAVYNQIMKRVNVATPQQTQKVVDIHA